MCQKGKINNSSAEKNGRKKHVFLKDGKYTFFWTISVIVILVLSLGIFCLPGCRREETHERQKNKMVSKIQEIERQIDAEHGLYGALRWQYNHAPEESSRQKVEIYKELSNRMSKILDLQKRRDSLIQLRTILGMKASSLKTTGTEGTCCWHICRIMWIEFKKVRTAQMRLLGVSWHSFDGWNPFCCQAGGLDMEQEKRFW